MSLKDLANRAKHMVIEDDAPSVPVAASAPHPHPAFNLNPGGYSAAAAPALSMGSPFAVPGTTVLDEKVYQSVLSKTSFDTMAISNGTNGGGATGLS